MYEGTIGSWASHTAKLCSTGGLTTATFAPSAGSSYYLVVPTDTVHEGSYGWDGQLVERPVGVSSCRPQQIGGSCGRCGDNIAHAPEVCDGTDLGGQTCETQGHPGGGVLNCAPDCMSFDTSDCF